MKCSAKEKWGFRLKAIYCDNHLFIAEKPAGIATQPEFHEMARAYIKERFKKPGNVFLEPVHRLDKPVSGLVLFARTSKALSRLNEAQRNRAIKKFYLARIEGEPPAKGTLRHHLIHGDHRALLDPNGKEAILHYKQLENGSLEIELVTGRYHQIRAQFAAIGHPLIGDTKYGATQKQEHIALHHHRLELGHPTTKELLVFQSDMKKY